MRRAGEGGREGGLCAITHLSRAHSHAARGIVNWRAGTLSLCKQNRRYASSIINERGKETCARVYVTASRNPRAASPSRGGRKRNGKRVDDDIRVAKMNFASGTFVSIPSRCLGDINSRRNSED